MTTVELRTRIREGYAVVVLGGELDTLDAEATAGAVSALTAGGQQLIIDLEALDFIDCHAVGALLGVRKTARQKGGDVLLAAPRGPVLRLLAVLAVPDVFASVAAAAGSTGARAARQAFTLLREQARSTNQRLTDAARYVIDSPAADFPPPPRR